MALTIAEVGELICGGVAPAGFVDARAYGVRMAAAVRVTSRVPAIGVSRVRAVEQL